MSNRWPRSKRHLHALADETETPPDALTATQSIAVVRKAAGNSLFHLELPGGEKVLAEMQARFRSTVWVRGNGFVVFDATTAVERENKIDGEIVNVVRDVNQWRKMPYWPKAFPFQTRSWKGVEKDSKGAESYLDEDDDEGPQMPPSSSEDEG